MSKVSDERRNELAAAMRANAKKDLENDDLIQACNDEGDVMDLAHRAQRAKFDAEYNAHRAKLDGLRKIQRDLSKELRHIRHELEWECDSEDDDGN